MPEGTPEKPKRTSHVLEYYKKKAAEDAEKKETSMLESFLSAFGLNILFRRK